MLINTRYFQHWTYQHIFFGAPLEFVSVPVAVTWFFGPVFVQKAAKVYRGKKMPGKMGNIYRTSFGLKVSSEYTRMHIGWLHCQATDLAMQPCVGVLSVTSVRIQTAAS